MSVYTFISDLAVTVWGVAVFWDLQKAGYKIKIK